MTSSNGNISTLLAICVGNSPAPGEFPAQRPVTRSFDVFFDLRLNKRLSKQSWGWWFETLSRLLWRHCNGSWISLITLPYQRSTHVCDCFYSYIQLLLVLSMKYVHETWVHDMNDNIHVDIAIYEQSVIFFQLNGILHMMTLQMRRFSALLALFAGNSPVICEFPAQRPVTRSFDVFFHLCLNKRLSKQSRGWWFETPSCSLLRHCNERLSE